MFGVDGIDVHRLLFRQSRDELACYHQRFLVRQGDVLAGTDRAQRRLQSGVTDERGQHHVDPVHLHDLLERIGTREDLDRQIRQRVAQRTIVPGITDHHRVGLKLPRLFDQQVDLVVRAQHFHHEAALLFAYDVQRLGPDGTGGAEDGNVARLERHGKPLYFNVDDEINAFYAALFRPFTKLR